MLMVTTTLLEIVMELAARIFTLLPPSVTFAVDATGTVTVVVDGAIFDVTISKPGLYPFVTHSFASVDMGAVGLLNVGDVGGTMSH